MEKKKKKILGSLNIDYTNFDETLEDGTYAYKVDEPVSVRRQSVYLPYWSGDEIRSVNDQLTIYTDLPILCKGEECEFSHTCPLTKHGFVKRFVGYSCPVEQINAFRYFAGYINDLDIDPAEFTDINIVNELVSIEIQIDRCNKLMKKESPVETMQHGKDRAGVTHNNRQPNQLMALQEKLRTQKFRIYKDLVADRKSKLDLEAKTTTPASASTQLYDLVQQARKVIKDNEEREEEPQKVFNRKLDL